MVLKYYGEVDDLQTAIEYYKQVFDVTVVKGHENGYHSNIKLYGQISFLLHKQKEFLPKVGYLVIKFEDEELEIYKAAVKKVKESNLVKIKFDEHKARWGTTFFEFTDRYGYNWDFEINNSALED